MLKNSLIIIFLTPVLIIILRMLAFKFNWVDRPNSRKIHKKPIPLIGGLALVVSACCSFFLLGNHDDFVFYLLLSACFVAIVGLFDDIYDLSALLRFVVQIAASMFIVYFAKIQLLSFGYLLLPSWDMQLGFLSIPITVFGVVGVINALNMSDGIDGLAAMTFFLPCLVLTLLANDSSIGQWLLLLLISVAIFVVFNKSQPFKVFLGDNGSMFLGFIFAWLLVYFSQKSHAIIHPVTALYLVGIPIYDTIFVMLRRFFRGVSPFQPDKTHLHHLFLSYGLTQTKTLFAIMCLQVLMISFGVITKNILPEYIQFYLFVMFSVAYYFILKVIWSKRNVS